MEKNIEFVIDEYCKADPTRFVFHGDCVEVRYDEGDGGWETYTLENFYDEFIGDQSLIVKSVIVCYNVRVGVLV